MTYIISMYDRTRRRFPPDPDFSQPIESWRVGAAPPGLPRPDRSRLEASIFRAPATETSESGVDTGSQCLCLGDSPQKRSEVFPLRTGQSAAERILMFSGDAPD